MTIQPPPEMSGTHPERAPPGISSETEAKVRFALSDEVIQRSLRLKQQGRKPVAPASLEDACDKVGMSAYRKQEMLGEAEARAERLLDADPDYDLAAFFAGVEEDIYNEHRANLQKSRAAQQEATKAEIVRQREARRRTIDARIWAALLGVFLAVATCLINGYLS